MVLSLFFASTAALLNFFLPPVLLLGEFSPEPTFDVVFPIQDVGQLVSVSQAEFEALASAEWAGQQ